MRAADEHAEVLSEFIRQVWDPAATPASVRAARAEAAAANVAEPGVAPPTWIALQGGRALGYVTTIPIRLWNGTAEWPAYWIKGLMVLPEFRSGPIGYLVLKEAVANLPRTGGLAVAPAARRLFEALGCTDLGAVPNWIRPIAPHRIVQRLDLEGLGLAHLARWAPTALQLARRTGLGAAVGLAGGFFLRGTAAVRRLGSRHLATELFDPARNASEVDALWLRIRNGFPSAVVRDAAYLLPRYPTGDGAPYRWLAVREGATLTGLAVVRRPRAEGDERLKGIKLATLADLWFPPDNEAAGLALLGAAEECAREFAADALVTTASSPALGALLRRQWYLPLAGNVHLLFRSTDPAGDGLGTPLDRWWITRGDGGADEAF